jgi:lactoylglutathione lyase
MAKRVVVNHVGHVVGDLARARRFYEELLGFEYWRELTPPQKESAKLLGLAEPLGSTICYLRCEGFVLELIHYADESHRRPPVRRSMDDPGLTHISLSCDVADVLARVVEYGGEVLTETDIDVAIFIRDPDGQLVELLPLDYADRVAAL